MRRMAWEIVTTHSNQEDLAGVVKRLVALGGLMVTLFGKELG